MQRVWMRRASVFVLMIAFAEMGAAAVFYEYKRAALASITETEERFEELLPIVYQDEATPEEAAEFEVIERDYEVLIAKARSEADGHEHKVNALGIASFLSALVGLFILGRAMAPADEPAV